MKTHLFFSLMSSAFILNACDSWPVVQSRIPWNAKATDIECIKTAVLATHGVEYQSQNIKKDHGSCHGEKCEVGRDEIAYRVTRNSKDHVATIALFEYEKGRKQIYHSAYGGNHQKFLEEDRKGFIEAQKAINANIQKFCPDVGAPTDPQ